jgi:hypothetical protein
VMQLSRELPHGRNSSVGRDSSVRVRNRDILAIAEA